MVVVLDLEAKHLAPIAPLGERCKRQFAEIHFVATVCQISQTPAEIVRACSLSLFSFQEDNPPVWFSTYKYTVQAENLEWLQPFAAQKRPRMALIPVSFSGPAGFVWRANPASFGIGSGLIWRCS